VKSEIYFLSYVYMFLSYQTIQKNRHFGHLEMAT